MPEARERRVAEAARRWRDRDGGALCV